MATKLLKPVVREEPRNGYIVILAPEGLYLREKGRRTMYGPLAYARLYLQAVRAEIDLKKQRRNSR
jgi:hypothetical protein